MFFELLKFLEPNSGMDAGFNIYSVVLNASAGTNGVWLKPRRRKEEGRCREKVASDWLGTK